MTSSAEKMNANPGDDLDNELIPGVSEDTKENIYAKGDARYAKIKAGIAKAKSMMGNWYSKGKKFLGEGVDKVAPKVLAAPEVVQHIDKKTNEAARGVGKTIGFEIASRYSKIEDGVKNWVEKKKQWIKEKQELAEGAKLLAQYAGATMAQAGKEKFNEKKQEVKSGISKLWSKLVEGGMALAAAAEMKRQKFMEEYRAKKVKNKWETARAIITKRNQEKLAAETAQDAKLQKENEAYMRVAQECMKRIRANQELRKNFSINKDKPMEDYTLIQAAA